MIEKILETEAEDDENVKPSEMKQVPTGFTSMDEFLNGFQRSDLIVLAGRPSMGKTSLALNIARNAAVRAPGLCSHVQSGNVERVSGLPPAVQ